MSLRKAHDTLERLASRETIAVELHAVDPAQIIDEMSAVGVRAQHIQIPETDIKQVRERLDISQSEFAARFGLGLDTVQNWEQERYVPDQAARLLLKIIEQRPDVVENILTQSYSRSFLDNVGSIHDHWKKYYNFSSSTDTSQSKTLLSSTALAIANTTTSLSWSISIVDLGSLGRSVQDPVSTEFHQQANVGILLASGINSFGDTNFFKRFEAA
jgi:putative transcriptional regulator